MLCFAPKFCSNIIKHQQKISNSVKKEFLFYCREFQFKKQLFNRLQYGKQNLFYRVWVEIACKIIFSSHLY